MQRRTATATVLLRHGHSKPAAVGVLLYLRPRDVFFSVPLCRVGRDLRLGEFAGMRDKLFLLCI